jgi:hypothetical protein
MHEPRHALTADATYDQIGEAGTEVPRTTPKKPRAPRKPRVADKDAASRDPAAAVPPSPEPATRAGEADAKDDADATPAPSEGAKILSLDQFRKK